MILDRKTQTGTNFSNLQGYSLSVDECSEIIRDYEMKDTQVLSKLYNLNLNLNPGAEQGDQPLHGPDGLSQVKKNQTQEKIFCKSQVCYELFPFPNHQQSDG